MYCLRLLTLTALKVGCAETIKIKKLFYFVLSSACTTFVKKRRNMKYKMIVLDLDGTLTNEQKKITPKTKEALMRAQENGIKVVLAS